MITKRRLDDDTDDLAMFLGVAVPFTQEAEEEEEVDEMGRVKRKVDDSSANSGARRYRREDRVNRRNRRRSKRPTNGVNFVAGDEDGFSTDSSLGQADSEDFASAQSGLMRRVQNLSQDVVAEDFRDPVLGLAKRFGGWRKEYGEEYENAYGGLAMVQGWEYWARKEMVGWEPARVSCDISFIEAVT